MKTALFFLLSIFLLSCEKDQDSINQGTELSVRDLGIQLNTNYQVQKLQQGQFVDLPGPVLVNFVSELQVSEKNGSFDAIVNDYKLPGKGTLSSSSYKIVFFAIAPNCQFTPCPIVTGASINSEIYKEGDNILVKRLTDIEGDTFRLVKQ